MFKSNVLFVWIALISALSLVAFDAFSDSPTISPMLIDDKLQHVIAFFVLTLILLPLRPTAPIAVGAVLIAFGGGIEVLQMFTARKADWDDFSADVIGVLLGLAVWWAVRRALRLRGSR